MPTVLLTGGAGYVGSHTCVELLQAGWQVTVLDNFANASPECVARVERLGQGRIAVERADLCDASAVERVFSRTPFTAVIHCAGLKAVGESVEQPLRYYANNLTGTLNLLDAMQRHQCHALVFSSSATVYGDPERVPLTEDCALRTTNPYGATKHMIERMCLDVAATDPRWRIAVLRYFNPVGAHPSGDIGEDPSGIPNNLCPYILQVAVGKRPHLTVHGADWPTPDGSGVRDYVHIVDLAQGHVAALTALPNWRGCRAFNLGTGRGVSVFEMIQATEAASGRRVPYVVGPRRSGDIAVCYADVSRAQRELQWTARRGLAEMCADGWRWQRSNPNGFNAAR